MADAVIANPPTQGHIHIAQALHLPLHIMFTMPWSPTRAFPHPFTHVISEAHPGLRNRLSYEVFDLLTWLGLSDLVNEFRERTLRLERVRLGLTPPPVSAPGYQAAHHCTDRKTAMAIKVIHG